jgi:hypothetical protein
MFFTFTDRLSEREKVIGMMVEDNLVENYMSLFFISYTITNVINMPQQSIFFILQLSSMLFKHSFILEQKFSSPYHFTGNQNSDNESLNIHLTYTMHSLPIHYPFYGITVVLR